MWWLEGLQWWAALLALALAVWISHRLSIAAANCYASIRSSPESAADSFGLVKNYRQAGWRKGRAPKPG